MDNELANKLCILGLIAFASEYFRKTRQFLSLWKHRAAMISLLNLHKEFWYPMRVCTLQWAWCPHGVCGTFCCESFIMMTSFNFFKLYFTSNFVCTTIVNYIKYWLKLVVLCHQAYDTSKAWPPHQMHLLFTSIRWQQNFRMEEKIQAAETNYKSPLGGMEFLGVSSEPWNRALVL